MGRRVTIERSVHIARAPEDVFAFVCDPLNDPLWCPKVRSVEPSRPEQAPAPGARYRVVHRPIPFRPERQMDHELVAWDPPGRIEWREDDGHDVLVVAYLIDPEGEGTRFTQRDEAELGAPRLLLPLLRVGIGADIRGQLRRLRRLLERD